MLKWLLHCKSHINTDKINTSAQSSSYWPVMPSPSSPWWYDMMIPGQGIGGPCHENARKVAEKIILPNTQSYDRWGSGFFLQAEREPASKIRNCQWNTIKWILWEKYFLHLESKIGTVWSDQIDQKGPQKLRHGDIWPFLQHYFNSLIFIFHHLIINPDICIGEPTQS